MFILNNLIKIMIQNFVIALIFSDLKDLGSSLNALSSVTYVTYNRPKSRMVGRLRVIQIRKMKIRAAIEL